MAAIVAVIIVAVGMVAAGTEAALGVVGVLGMVAVAGMEGALCMAVAVAGMGADTQAGGANQHRRDPFDREAFRALLRQPTKPR